MALKEEKKQAVMSLKEKLSRAGILILTDYRGLNVAQISELRGKLREEGIEYKVVKNTLTRIAARESGLEALNAYLEGPTAIAFGQEDPVAPAKILTGFAKGNDRLEIKAGMLSGGIIDLPQLKALADLPSREVLLGRVAGAMQAPVYGAAYAFNGLLTKTAYALKAICDQKAQEA